MALGLGEKGSEARRGGGSVSRSGVGEMPLWAS